MTIPFTVQSTGAGVAQEITVLGDHAHRFHSDTYAAFGGADAAPSPLAYALGALTSCNQVTAQLVATDLGVELGEFALTARGDLDPSVFTTGSEGNANFDAVSVDVSVETDADPEVFERLVGEVDRRCPVTQLFRRSGLDFTTTWKARPLVR